MAQVQRGEPEAFEQLVRRYGEALYAFFVRLGSSPSDAEDLVQDTFLRVFKARATFDPQRPLRPWLYGIATHVWGDERRQRRGAWATAAGGAPVVEEPAGTAMDDAAAQAERRDMTRHIQEAMHQLPEVHRMVLILRHYHGLSYEGISQALGISVGTVKSRIHYALAKLREELQRWGLLEA
ncbi:MAG: RNA polymerase sigma factor [Candidatus Entotheonellia bacterium]